MKPKGWWTTHPTILSVTVAGSWDSNGDGIGDFEGIRQNLDDHVGAAHHGARQWVGAIQFGLNLCVHGIT